MQALLIVNPVAGHGISRERALKLKKALNTDDFKTDLMFTSKNENAAELVVKNGSESDMVICCGGDGTLSETVGGIMQLKRRPKLAYLPNGTTNDFAKSIGLRSTLNVAATDIINGNSMKLDTGLLNNRSFIYVASFGLMSKCSYNTPQKLKRRFGRLAYIFRGLGDFITTKPQHVKVTDENGKVYEDDYLFGCVSNSKSIGGIIHLDDTQVGFGDGKHEVILIKYPRSPLALKRIISAARKRDYNNKYIQLFHTSSVTFESDKPLRWSLDGEPSENEKFFKAVTKPAAIDFVLQTPLIKVS
ncbi:MAG: YegS/Rv2252/BmrU family lipid kinase [Ruminococcus sp.]|nr:YegS/Rv2252/BmrU family lipid kinase [Ruminococcus sp.]